ncbi:MAG TPA: STAS domain-containing protein [Actinomycetota bacterium]|nr:STAS domain-containing protein [Actinomycetota bacterium]
MGTGQALNTRIDARNGVTSIALSGELDMATVPVLKDQLAASEQNGTKEIVLDLRDLRFIDSSGLHEIVRAYRRSETNGHRLLVVGASPLTRRMCEITGTEFLLNAQGTAGVLSRFTTDGAETGVKHDVAGSEPHV